MRSGLYDLRVCGGFVRNSLHGIDKEVAFFLGLGFRWLDHHGARNNQRERRRVRMKAIVDQAFRYVHSAHAVFLLLGIAEHHFVHRGQGIRQIENSLKLLSNVIRIQNGVFRGLPHSRTIRKDVCQRANQHAEISCERFHPADGIRSYGLQRQPAAFFFHQNGHGPERLENLFHRYWSNARPAAKCFVQVEVHHVDSQVAWPRHASERVHVRAVHIQQCSFGVQNLGDLRDTLLEDSQRRRIGDHQRRDISGHQFAQFFDVDLPVGFGLDILDFVSRDHGRRGIRSVCGIRNQNLLARIPLLLQKGANQQKARKLSLCACGRLERDGVHAGYFQQALFQQPHDFQAALREFLRLIGMLRGNAIESRDELIYARVILHGAGAKRIHAQIDRVVPRRKTRKVAENFDLAHFRKPFDARAPVICAQRFSRIDGGHVERRQFERALPRRRFLKDQSFALIRVPRSFFDSFVHSQLSNCRGAACCAPGGDRALDRTL